MSEAVPLNLIPDELKGMKGTEVPLGMLPDEFKPIEITKIPKARIETDVALGQPELAISHVPSPVVTGIPTTEPIKPGIIKEVAKAVPFAAIRGLEAVTAPITAPLEAMGIGTRKMLQESAEYWRPELGGIPNYIIDIDEKFRPSIKRTGDFPVSEIVGGMAGTAGFVLGPGMAGMTAGRLVTSLPAIEKVARPFYRDILAGMIGGTLTGEGKVDETLQNAALFGLFSALPHLKEIPQTIKSSNVWRRATIKERGLVLQSLEDTIKRNPDMSEGEILRTWNNPAWFQQALGRRVKPEPIEPIVTEPIIPTQIKAMPIIPVEKLKPPKIVKPEPIKPIIKGQEVPLEMVPKELVKPEAKVEGVKPISTEAEEMALVNKSFTETLTDAEVKRLKDIRIQGVFEEYLKKKAEKEAIPPTTKPLPEEEVFKEAMPVSEKRVEKGKEPWEMRGIEYSKIVDPEGWNTVHRKMNVTSEEMMRTEAWNIEANEHKKLVQDALSEGKPVPPEVLADYPDLQAAPPRVETSEQAQKAIDDKIDELMSKGMPFDEASKHPEVEKLFHQRDLIDKKDLNIWKDIVIKDSGLPKEETINALKSLEIGRWEETEVYFTGETLKNWGIQTEANLARLYNHFTEGKDDRTLATFRWGGTADEPILQGSIIEGRRFGWDKEALKKTEKVFNAISKTQGQEPIDLSRISKGVMATPLRVETVKAPPKEFDLLNWVRSKGGIDPDTVSADIKSLTQKESGFRGRYALVRKGGRGLDELAQEFEWETGRPITTDELTDAIKGAVESKKKGIPRGPGLGATDQDIAKFIEKVEREKYRGDIVVADEKLAQHQTFENLTKSFDDEIIGFREEAIRNGYTEAYTNWAIEKARTRIKNEKVPATLEGLRKILSEEITSRTPEVTITKPTEEFGPPSFQPPRPPTTEQYFSENKIDRNVIEKYEKDFNIWEKSIPNNKPIITETDNLIYLITKDPEGGWRATTISKIDHMPMGHSRFNTRLEAIKEHRYEKRIENIPFEIEPLPPRIEPTPVPSPTRKGEQLLPGMKVGLEQPKAEAVTPTLEGTPLMEAARKAEVEKVQPRLFKEPVPEKTISQFTEEYREGLGEGGFIKVGGVEKAIPKVVTPGTKDVSLPEFGLTTLHIADRHPFLKPIIEANIKAEQDTNHWILRKSDKISEAFDKVERPTLWQHIFGRKGTGIKDLDLIIEGKTPIPTQLTGFVTEIKGILGDIRGEIIQKMKDDFSESLSSKQREYLDWEVGGRMGEEPKIIVGEYTYKNKKGQSITVPEHTRPVPKATKLAVEGALKQFKEMEGWGIQDYFPHIFKGKYKYLTEDGHIIASGQTAKQAKANFMEYVESHPETTEQTFMFVNDFYDLLTVRKVLNPELTNPLEYLGTRLSRKEFFHLLGRTEKVIKEEIANAGVADIPKVKVDMSGIASFQKGTKFSGHFLKRKTSLRGEETDPFKALMSYVFSVGRKLGLEDAKMASYSFADSLPKNMPNAKSYIKMQADNMSGRYNIVDKIFDETIGEKLGMKPFGITRIFAKGVGLESKLKLGYAPAKTAINRMGGIFHTILQEGGKNYYEGRKVLKAKDPELMGRIEKEGHLAGMEQLFAGEGLIGVSEKQTSWWRPLGTYQKAEVKNRSEALAAGYVAGLKKFSGDKDAAWIYAIDSARLTQGLYNIAAKPVPVRGPILQASYQFKQYLANEIRFMSQLTPAQWAGYIAGITAVAGTRGALLTIKSLIGIGIVGIGIDEIMERLNRKAPRLHRGIFGLIGVDVSAPASWQIPTSVKDWIGVFPRDIWETGEMIIKGLQNEGWTDEEINDYIRQITPVGYNIFKGLQMLSEGAIKEGTKVIYRGGREEGVINLTGAKPVKQSQASDSARYMNQQRKLFLEKSRVLEDRLFGSKSREEAENTFKELVELKNIQTPEEMQDFISGLRNSAKSRILTEEARIFMTLPRALKKQEILRR